MVKGLVELHQGSISAASLGLNQGSNFTVRLPSCPAPPDRPLQLPDRGPGNESCRVLIIDDNSDVATPLSRMLSLNGHRVALADDGPTGLQTAREFMPDLVLCDIGLPGKMNGYDVARAWRGAWLTIALSCRNYGLRTGFGPSSGIGGGL